MGNAHVKPQPRSRNKKVHWDAAEIIQKHAEQGHSNRPSPPGKPFQLTDHDQVPDAILVGWARPVTDGGSPVTGYLVEHRRVGTSHWIQAAPCLVNETELLVGSLDPGWRYQFRVRAENEVGLSDPGEVSEPLTLNLQKSAVMPPKFTQDLQDTTTLENEKAEFVVHFLGQPLPKICWFKDGFEIFSARRTRILTESGRSVLTIHQSALNDEGEIKCTATNRAGHASSRARLTLEAPPSIRLPRQYEEGLLFEIGEMMRLKVTVAGRPTPLLFWYHNGEVLQNSDRYEMKYGERTSSLKIDVAKRCDRGEYQIKAVNKLGEDTASFLVTVTDKPSPPQKARVVMTLGRSVTLSWSTPDDDGGCKIGNYIVEYFRVGWNVWLKAATSRQLSTVLGDLIEGSEYKFRVKAESPYGVSDPSIETETVFIPDPKRGLTTPHERSRSQPRDIIEEISPPVATRRAKPRSESASRVETRITANLPQNSEVPIRPSRSKIKSPPKTPELSPKVDRKDLHTSINKAIFDRSSFEQELAYGSPDIKPKKLELEIPSDYLLNYSSSEKINRTGRRSRSPSPFSRSYSSPEQQQLWSSSENVARVTSPSHAPKSEIPVVSDDTKLKSPVAVHKSLSRQNSENATGSSEFMLVLYPDGNEKGHQSFADAFTFDSELIPPPLSLSAPELGTEPPVFERLRHAASSTELLQERTMIRLNKEAEEEMTAKEAQRDRKQSSDIPKIQINSQDNQDIVGLDRQGSGKRRGSFGSHKQPIWVQRRHSLRGPNDIMEEVQQVILKTDANNDRKILERQKQVTEEKEPVIFEKIRSRSPFSSQQSIDRKTPIEIFENRRKPKEAIEEYSSESESDNDGRVLKNIVQMMPSFDKEDATYHPGNTSMSKTTSDEPFEVLTVKKEPPDPNFVPKPILKKVENDMPVTDIVRKPERKSTFPSVRSSSPLPKSRDRSSSLTMTIFDDYPIQRQRSGSLNVETLDNEYLFLKELEKSKPKSTKKKLPSLTQAAQISAITAAGVIIPENLLQKKQAEDESKVLIDHYGDIVKSYGAYKKVKDNTPVEEDYTTKQASENSNEPSLEDFMAAKSQGVEYSSRKSERDEKRNVPINYVKSSKNETFAKEQPQREILPISAKEIVTAKEPTPQFFAHRPTSFEQELNEANYKNVSANSNTNNFSVEKVMEALNKIEGNNERQQPVTRIAKETNKRASSSRSSSKTRKSRRTPSKSPHRYENWSPLRSNSPYRRDTRSKSNSPGPQPRRAPKMREIMTQTSIGFGEYPNSTTSKSSSKQGDMLAKVEVKVRTTVDYITDLTMLAVAFWFYVFGNELLALPFLFLLVFRQIQEAIRKRLPKWLLRMFRRKKNNLK